ncbi:C39 family peptidase [Paraburkholderia sp. JPY419]|uniref:C39 family peptidase n=1 Tax=Paraburkholderia sp. JPY419 TaxID=667660 RepID=UPI003D1BA7C6
MTTPFAKRHATSPISREAERWHEIIDHFLLTKERVMLRCFSGCFGIIRAGNDGVSNDSATEDQAASNQRTSSGHRPAGDIRLMSLPQRAVSTRRPSKMPALISGDMIPAQNGHTCKPTALAALDAYFAKEHGVRSIPLRKGMVSRSDTNVGSERPISVRQIAKSNGSRQGEILQADMFLRVAQQMGYEARALRPTDMNDFRKTVIDSIASKKPLVTCFAVNRKTGFPSMEFDGGNEHAALIVGYDQKGDTVDIAHWETLFEAVPVEALYESMQKIPATRQQEIYLRTGASVSSATPKYSPAQDENASSDNSLLYSIIPEQGSGFKNTLFSVRPDPAHDRWSSTRLI